MRSNSDDPVLLEQNFCVNFDNLSRSHLQQPAITGGEFTYGK